MKLYSDRIVLKDSIVDGYIEIEKERIKDLCIGEKPQGEYLDFTGKFILPGMINIQDQTFMKQENSPYFSRYPRLKAFNQIERINAISGITTVYHTLDMSAFLKEHSEDEAMEELSYLRSYDDRSFLLDHQIHLKFEIGNISNIDFIRTLINHDLVDMITYEGREINKSYKDEYLFEYIKERFHLKESIVWEIMERIQERRMEINLEEMNLRLRYAQEAGIPVATTEYAISRSLQKNYQKNIPIILDPFEPESLEYVQKSQKYATIDINNLWDFDKITNYSQGVSKRSYNILTATQHTEDLLESVFVMEAEIGMVDSVRMVSYNPACALGMNDRGELAVGKMADMIVVDCENSIPTNIMTISRGKIVMQLQYHRVEKIGF